MDSPLIKATVQGLWAVIIVGAILMHSPLASANSKKMGLEQKLADMALLRHQLSDRTEQAKMIREKFRHQKQSFIDEIDELRKAKALDRFEKADQHSRVHYNLQLISTVDAYLDQIENKIIQYGIGQDKLAYLQKLAGDDIRMINTLNDLEIDALTTHISLVINQYFNEAHIIQLNPTDFKPSSPQKIWESIAKSR